MLTIINIQKFNITSGRIVILAENGQLLVIIHFPRYGCKYVRDVCKAYWLFDAILSYQGDKVLRNVNFQIWELKQLKKDLSWQLTYMEDSGKRPLINQSVEFSDFPLDYIKIWVIDKVALLPSEY